MKSTTVKFLALISALIVYGTILFLFFAALPLSLRAQTNVSAAGGDSNVVIAPLKSPAATNAVSASNAVVAAKADEEKLSDNSTPVHIANAGIHVGGAEPVDINWGSGLGSGKTAIALIAVLTSFVLPVAIVVVLPVAILTVVFYFQHRRNKMAHETVRAMIEKGVPVTPELLAGLSARGKRQGEDGNPQTRRLLPGLILAGVGIGVIAVAGKPGLIVLFVGVAFLIVWLVERKNKNDTQPPKP